MKLAEIPAAAIAPSTEQDRVPALAPSGVSFALVMRPREGTIVPDADSLKINSIVRVLQGPLAGRVGLVTDIGGGNAQIGVVAPELKRRRRYYPIRIETGLRQLGGGDRPHLNPKVGDEVWVMQSGGQGPARVCAVNRQTATVRRLPDGIEAVDLGPEEPVLEVLYEPALRLSDGTEVSLNINVKEAFGVPIDVCLADALGEYLLEILDARERNS